MGKHAADAADAERRGGKPVLLLVVVLVVLFAGAGIIEFNASHGGGSSAGGSSGPDSASGACDNGAVPLVVAADPSAAGWISTLAKRYAGEHHTVDGQCVVPQVESLSINAAGTLLRADPYPGSGTPPDVWIPDSTVAYDTLRVQPDNAEVLPASATPIASSPLVLAAPASAATTLRSALGSAPTAAKFLSFARKPTGLGLGDQPLRMAISDPNRSSAGLATVLTAAASGGGEQTVVDLTTADFSDTETRLRLLQLQGLISTVQPTSGDLLARARKASSAADLLHGTGILVVPERSVVTYNADKPAVPLQPVYAFSGKLALDYPYVPVHAAWVTDRKQQAAAAFRTWLTSRAAQDELGEYGLRRADGSVGTMTGSGLDTHALQPVALRSAAAASTGRSAWTLLTSQRSVLALIDVSGSMAAKVPGTNSTRLDLCREAAVGALPYFSAKDQIGLWEFSTDLAGGGGDGDYRDLVPLAPADTPFHGQPRRAATIAAYQAMTPQQGTALYNSILAAYNEAQAHYTAGALNAVVVLTDGKDEDDPNSIGLSRLLSALAKRQNPGQPVRIVTIGYGNGTDATVLAQIAKATGGLSFNTPDPRSIGTVFITALAALAH